MNVRRAEKRSRGCVGVRASQVRPGVGPSEIEESRRAESGSVRGTVRAQGHHHGRRSVSDRRWVDRFGLCKMQEGAGVEELGRWFVRVWGVGGGCDLRDAQVRCQEPAELGDGSRRAGKADWGGDGQPRPGSGG